MRGEKRKVALSALEKARVLAQAKLDYWPDDEEAKWLVGELAHFKNAIDKQWPLSKDDKKRAEALSLYNVRNLRETWEEISKEILNLTHEISS